MPGYFPVSYPEIYSHSFYELEGGTLPNTDEGLSITISITACIGTSTTAALAYTPWDFAPSPKTGVKRFMASLSGSDNLSVYQWVVTIRPSSGVTTLFSHQFDPETNVFNFNPYTRIQPTALNTEGRSDRGRHRPASGEDAFFISRVGETGDVAVGIADGVGGWAESGVDPADFSHTFCDHMASAAYKFKEDSNSKGLKPRELMQMGYQSVVEDSSIDAGGSTACIGVARKDGTLEVANPQTHAFNTPYQLSVISAKLLAQITAYGGTYLHDSPDDATVSNHTLRHGDVLIFASDGVWDNLSAHDTLRIISQYMTEKGAWESRTSGMAVGDGLGRLTDRGESRHLTLQSTLAVAVATHAKVASLNTKIDGPFAKEVHRYYPGETYHGGKVDDICVVVLLVLEDRIPNTRIEIYMTATASPTPAGPDNLSQRSSTQLATRRQHLHPIPKCNSPVFMASLVEGVPSGSSRKISIGDSSDDDILMPMKFSALTKALLDGEQSVVDASSPSSQGVPPRDRAQSRRGSLNDRGDHNKLPSKQSPQCRNGSPCLAPRVVRLSSGSPSSTAMRRSAPSSGSQPASEGKPSRPQDSSSQELITPAPRPRNIQIKGGVSYTSMSSSGSSSNNPNSSDRSLGTHEENAPMIPVTTRSHAVNSQGNILPYGSSTVGRARGGEEYGLTAQGSSLRVKRVGKVAGSFLSGPARRGRRRQSEEDGSSGREDTRLPSVDNGVDAEARPPDNVISRDQSSLGLSGHCDPNRLPQEDSQHLKPIIASPAPKDRDVKSLISNSPQPQRVTLQSAGSGTSSKFPSAHLQPTFKVPAPPPSMPSAHDQENEPPPTFKRNKPSGFALLDQVKKASNLPGDTMLGAASAAASPERRVLSARNQNTPHRPAPPPPKMSVLETATATAGAATTSHSRKRRNHVIINGKTFTRMDCIGRGGSSRVYRVMAENYKIFALKKVTLEDVDEIAIRGYKGEIELLKKLDSVDRVVRLFDWEVNDEKQTLSVLMEIGDSDLSRILTVRLNPENAKFDISLTRHYWKEMLECVQAVHGHDIVHSDLKPANFLLVQGRLKLIDFGIANAIQDDTVNVHREQQVGTPNYMSPEAIVDSNSKSGLPSNAGKMMKLGKASDIWSLGCILYQMVYGKPPFAHITNQIQRIMAIPNPNHIIEYPTKGVGGMFVPPCLVRTLKGCLQRDQHLRPTIRDLLDERDPFLYPDSENEGLVEISQDLLGRILANVVNHCDKIGIPSEAELATWPAGFFARIKRALREEGRG
ncbi:hypothetical protein FGG08_006082 [Glutinoglossum americanum]|uniref:Protein kinase domain-containing protein n=1 Tax=Glutinoglossum americanum TaxID=1670608 RepID=A0A9P8I1Y4_9PEZI|nr:hypothetical protein FGG08_006082 [Glutinoglossum americanum]